MLDTRELHQLGSRKFQLHGALEHALERCRIAYTMGKLSRILSCIFSMKLRDCFKPPALAKVCYSL